MDILSSNYFKVAFIGIITGALASFIGGGTEIIIVPLLIYLNVVNDYKEAVATSLASLLLPIGIVAVYFYNKQNCKKKCIHWEYALTISLFFVIGTFVSYYSSKLESKSIKIYFATILIVLGFFMFYEELYKN